MKGVPQKLRGLDLSTFCLMTLLLVFRLLKCQIECSLGADVGEVNNKIEELHVIPITLLRGHGGRVVTLPPPTSEAGVQFPAWPHVGELIVACCWSAVYSTEP